MFFLPILYIFVLPTSQYVYPDYSVPVVKPGGAVFPKTAHVNQLTRITLRFMPFFEGLCGKTILKSKKKECVFKLSFNGKLTTFEYPLPEQTESNKTIIKHSLLINTIGMREGSCDIEVDLFDQKYTFGEISLKKPLEIMAIYEKESWKPLKPKYAQYMDRDYLQAIRTNISSKNIYIKNQRQFYNTISIDGGGLYAGIYKIIFEAKVNGITLMYPFLFFLSVSNKGGCSLRETSPNYAYDILDLSCHLTTNGVSYKIILRRRICLRENVIFKSPKLVYKVDILSSKFDLLYKSDEYFAVTTIKDPDYGLKNCWSINNHIKVEWRDRMSFTGINDHGTEKVYAIRRSGYNIQDGSMEIECTDCEKYTNLNLLDSTSTASLIVREMFKDHLIVSGDSPSSGINPLSAATNWPSSVLRRIEYNFDGNYFQKSPYFILEEDYVRFHEDLVYYELFPLRYKGQYSSLSRPAKV